MGRLLWILSHVPEQLLRVGMAGGNPYDETRMVSGIACILFGEH